MDNVQPRIFIASSVEGKDIADALEIHFQHDGHCTAWHEAFPLSNNTIDTLLTKLAENDFAIFVFSPDDRVMIRKGKFAIARDNVLFEAGLFMGMHGKERAFIVTPEGSSSFHVPTDFSGFTHATYNHERAKREPGEALGAAAARIRQAIKKTSWSQRKLVSKVFLKRQEVPWAEYNERVTNRFWAAGTSLIEVAERGVIGQLAKKGARDIRVVLPATASCFASFIQLVEYDRRDCLHQEQVQAAARSYQKCSEAVRALPRIDPKDVLRLYSGVMYCNITIFDDDAFMSFYDSVGVGDDNITLHFHRDRNAEGYQRAEKEFLNMWEASLLDGTANTRRVGTGMLFVNNSDQLLLYLRDDKERLEYANRWDILGGHLEGTETPLQCICREVKEEIGVEVKNPFFYCHFTSDGTEQFMFWKKADFDIDTLTLTEGQRLKWFSKQEINGMRDDEFAFRFGKFLRDFMQKQPWKHPPHNSASRLASENTKKSA
jgi:8-oxo-dGTP pyrophosphatase MutT (NUDIX family)